MTVLELDALIARHLADLDDGAKRLEGLQDRVSLAITGLVRDWADEHDWAFVESTWPEGELSFGMKSWVVDYEENDWTGWLELKLDAGHLGEKGPDRDYFWLTSLCGQGIRKLGFRLDQTKLRRRQAWKRFLDDHAAPFQGTGFVLDDKPSLFLPLRVDPSSLAEAIEADNIAAGLDGVRDALSIVHQTRSALDTIVRALAKEKV